ncbi:pectin lyase-like protein [Aureobasidium sp. EXF-10728]|nr:pectin lyase-like protein [Aureobasidium sp. EXF-10728]
MPFAPSGYKFFRDVTEYGAVGDGITDDTAAINRAITDGDRCGEECGSTSALGALVYFPPGEYLITTPIIQYYYTQFVGHPQDPPTIKGSTNFSGIALIDTDVYIPEGNGNEWYINQNQFYRQIRNFIIDLTQMPNNITQGDQTYVPCGIHWQVAQATSLQNIVFNMPVSGQVVNSGNEGTKAVGIFQENGSGGFVSDLTFNYGNIGYRAGSQQMTARNLVFNSCLTAISSIWNWGFTWQGITVNNCYQALDCSNFGGVDGQGTGSMSIIDSHFNSVPYAIPLTAGGPYPALYLDNVLVDGPNSHQIVFYSGHADSLLEVTQGDSLTVNGWAMGHRYQKIDGSSENTHGYIDPVPKRPESLNLDNDLFSISRPQYGSLGSGDIVNVLSHGVQNDATGDQTSAINSVLASSVGSVVFFPAGVYMVKGTVNVPVGSKIVGSAWSQIMATGSYFEDESKPQVMVRVGKSGDSGNVELSDLLFTVQGPTAGAILVEWNVKASKQGSAGMWDCHFRVGGAQGSDLRFSDCPKGASNPNSKCIAASMLMHITKQSSGYFENVWGWTADHDLDLPVDGNTTTSTQLDVYAGRGFLIESQGPTWLYGTAVEHNVLYQYQLVGARDIYLGCIQTETPYFQPKPQASKPFTIGRFMEDPTYPMCDGPRDNCEEAYALRIINSTDVFIYGAGLYSFFDNFKQGCLGTESCQQRLVETSFSQGVWIMNMFTKGAVEVASPLGGIPPVLSKDTQEQYTTEVSVWTPLGDTGADIGGFIPGNGDGVTQDGNDTYVYIDPSVWGEDTPTIQCEPPCTFVLPPYQLSTTTTISFPPFTTSLDVAWTTTLTFKGSDGKTTTSKTVTRTIQRTTLSIPPVTTTAIPFWEVPYPNPTANDPNGTVIYITQSIQPTPFVITDDPNPQNKTGVSHPVNTRTITPPPYPYSFSTPTPRTTPTTTTKSSTTPVPIIVSIHTGTPSPKCKSLVGCGSRCKIFCGGPCLFNCPGHQNTDFPDSNDPDPPLPPDDPEDPEDDPDECEEGDEDCEEEEDQCDASLSSSTGVCANGNFPFYDVGTGTISCDFDSKTFDLFGGDDAISSCQRMVDDDPEAAEDLINAAKTCCSSDDTWQELSKRSGISGLFGRAPVQKPCPPYPAVPYYKANPPANGRCHTTYTCNGSPANGFPNVCANARSAITARGRTDVLTYAAGADFHDTEIWQYGKFGWQGSVSFQAAQQIQNGLRGPEPGWGLVGCQIEEYPFGSGHPTKSKSRTNPMGTRSVNRLIWHVENGAAGNDLSSFYRTAGQAAYNALGLTNTPGNAAYNYFQLADGLKYCVDFTNTPTTNDDAGYLLDSPNHNLCAQPYGVGFTLANQAYNSDLPRRNANGQLWDPWFNSRLTSRVVKRVPNQADQLMNLPDQWCEAPSPGLKIYNPNSGAWENNDIYGIQFGYGTPRNDPGDQGINLRCNDVPGGNPVKRDLANETFVPKTMENGALSAQAVPNKPADIKSPEGRIHQAWTTVKDMYRTLVRRFFGGEPPSTNFQSKRPVIRGRQAGIGSLGLSSGGSFTDGSVYKYFSCPNDDYDPCANGDAGCGSGYQPGPYADSDYISTGSVAPPPSSTKAPDPSPTSTDPPPPSTPTSSPPTYTSGGETYPGQFEVFFYTSLQYGPMHEIIKTNTGLAGYERPQGAGWKVCHFSGINEVSQNEAFVGSAKSPKMPASIDVIRIYGDTCSYAETQDEYGAKEGDVVGSLKCPLLGDASCVKNTKETGGCSLITETSLVLCSWN